MSIFTIHEEIISRTWESAEFYMKTPAMTAYMELAQYRNIEDDELAWDFMDQASPILSPIDIERPYRENYAPLLQSPNLKMVMNTSMSSRVTRKIIAPKSIL